MAEGMITLFVVVEDGPQEDVWPATVGGGNDLIKDVTSYIHPKLTRSNIVWSNYLLNILTNQSAF